MPGSFAEFQGTKVTCALANDVELGRFIVCTNGPSQQCYKLQERFLLIHSGIEDERNDLLEYMASEDKHLEETKVTLDQVQQQRRLYGKDNALCTASRYLMECRVVWQQLRQRSEQCGGRSCLHDRGGRYPLRDPNACGTNGNFAAAGRGKAHSTTATISNRAQS